MTVYPTSPVTPFATTTGTAETAQQTFTVPSGAVELVAVRGHVTSEAPAPAEGLAGVFKITGQDWQHTPYEFFSEIGGNHLGSINGSAYAIEPRWWAARLGVKAGSTIACTIEMLDALAGNGEASIDCLWSSTRTGLPPVQRLCSRETASTTATGASITVTNASRVVDFTYAYVPNGVLVADEEASSILTVNSGGLSGQQTMSLSNIVHGIEATSGQSWTTLMKAEVDIAVRDDPAVFNSSIALTSTSTNADCYAYSIGYIPKTLV